jgi:Ser/Thr protein kinase RdoA (MazF antagonist)
MLLLSHPHVMSADVLFPVSYSTLSCEALTAHVLSCYGIGTIKNCQMWNRGLSDVYLIETEQDHYILRVSHSHWRSGDEVQFEMAFLDFLGQAGIPVATPLRTEAGELAIELIAPEGKRYATLLKYAPGEIPLGGLNQLQSAKLGATVAEIHQASLEFQPTVRRPDLTLDYLLDDSIDLILSHLPNPNGVEYLRETRDRLQTELANLPKLAPFWVVCWGDPHSGNVHFTEAQQPTLFDFDQCGYGWRAFDVAKFLQQGLCSGMSYVVRDAFITGYQSVMALTDEEFVALMPLTQVAHCWRWAISLNYALRHESSRLDSYYFTNRVEQLRMLGNQDWQAMRLAGKRGS